MAGEEDFVGFVLVHSLANGGEDIWECLAMFLEETIVDHGASCGQSWESVRVWGLKDKVEVGQERDKVCRFGSLEIGRGSSAVVGENQIRHAPDVPQPRS